jgi:DNA-binding winged helix-turn-helix (wHTH) protein
MEPLRPTSVVRFGNYEVSLQSGEVRKAGLKIRVQHQPLKLLEILLERPGEVVTREELRSRVWSDESFGDFDQAVNIAIGKLRSALGDSAENPRFIETLPKRGYRFIADVSVVDGEAHPKRPESAVGDLPGLQEKKTEPEPKVQDAGLAVAPKRMLRPALPRRSQCHQFRSGASVAILFWRQVHLRCRIRGLGWSEAPLHQFLGSGEGGRSESHLCRTILPFRSQRWSAPGTKCLRVDRRNHLASKVKRTHSQVIAGRYEYCSFSATPARSICAPASL